MIGRWVRRVIARQASKLAPLTPLPTTARQLTATLPQHRRTIKATDALLRDWAAFDGAFRIEPVRKS